LFIATEMSLREDIFKIVNDIHYQSETGSKEATNEIISKIEKRINDWVEESNYDEEVEGCADKMKEFLK